MGFTTQIFFFCFLPICLIVYYGIFAIERHGRFGLWMQKRRLRDVMLIMAGLGFYAWTCFDHILRLLIYMLMVYFFGQLIDQYSAAGLHIILENDHGESKKYSLRTFMTGLFVAALIFCLVYGKYWTQVVSAWNWIFHAEMPIYNISAPLAISFLTFSSVSYLVDVSRKEATTGSLLDCLLYLSFFPKIISGPTVLWKDFQVQIPNRRPELNPLADGFTRIMIGFVKKVLVADVLGACMIRIPETSIDIPTAWISAFLYMLQIYYDFSGYSDIAVGLAKLFGFEIKENFHFPYCATSVGEFWRRWHISLGAWFREYVYFPLGGSRGSLRKTLRNLGIVFLLTGLWHGNGWNYLIWGGINGAFVILERLLSGKRFYKKMPRWIKWAGTMGITFFCWEFFRFGRLSSVLQWCKIAVGLISYPNIDTWQYYFDKQIAAIAVVGLAGATLFGAKPVQAWYRRMVSTPIGYAVRQTALAVLFAISIMFMVSSGYSPFIYFQY